MFRVDRRIDRDFYIFGWCGIGAGVLALLFSWVTGIQIFKYLWPCVFHLLTGYYCPGCGGTRAVKALLSGKLFASFWYHPFVPYVAVLAGWFMISQTIERISGGRLKIGMHFREIYMWIAIAIIVINCLVKNLALIVWNIDLLA